ncbi:MAG: putative cytokinetic ring protein SteA, partial [Solirubrobacteraceae bacterium]
REVGDALERFAHNTIAHMREERELLAGRIDLPRFDTDFRDRSALVVVRGVDHQHDLRALRPFIRDMRPVLVAVDGGTEALLQEGLCPDMIVGDMDSAGEAALLRAYDRGAELVVHSYSDGRAPGRARLDELGLPYKLVPAPGTSQDVAMLLAAEKGARLIVSVGSPFNLLEFLDRNREGMSSTFLTRLRIGEILVDAKGVSRLYHPRPGLTPLLVVIAAGLIALIAVVAMTPALRDVAELLWLRLQLLLGAG